MSFSHNFPQQCSGKHDEKFHEQFYYVEALIDAFKVQQWANNALLGVTVLAFRPFDWGKI